MKLFKLFFLLILFLFFPSSKVIAQADKDSAIARIDDRGNIQKKNNIETRNLFKRKGNFFLYWGYNRSAYTNSDINLWGDGYNFTIYNITAKDDPIANDPSPSYLTYINPNTFTRPQYNFRTGYFLTDKYFITFGIDHMGYKIDKQATYLTGRIESGINAGEYFNTEVLVGEDYGNGTPSIVDSLPKGFVSEFEHCDGLNNIDLEFGRLEQLWISKNTKHAWSVLGTIGLGIMVPDSESEILEQPAKHNTDKETKSYHLAGYSFSASFGFQFDFYKHFFLQTRVKGGYINMPDITTTIYGGRASQHFYFAEAFSVLGYRFSIH